MNGWIMNDDIFFFLNPFSSYPDAVCEVCELSDCATEIRLWRSASINSWDKKKEKFKGNAFNAFHDQPRPLTHETKRAWSLIYGIHFHSIHSGFLLHWCKNSIYLKGFFFVRLLFHWNHCIFWRRELSRIIEANFSVFPFCVILNSFLSLKY